MIAKLTTCAAMLLALSWDSSAKATESTVPQQVDQAIAEELFSESTLLAPRCDDETFLRRAHLDLVGDIPTPELITTFLLDSAADKRQQLVQELLESPHYGQNWARYWRDVVFFRALEDRAKIAASAMVADLAVQLNENTGWDRIAAQFITARGDVKENGHAAIIMAQDGRTEATAAEVSRIFLGIQIQCAQCHDHPYDRWQREQFHELAAFFPRIAVRNVRDMTKRSFEVYSNDRYRNKKRKENNDRRPQAEHRMPDLVNPAQPGTTMQPKFFLTGISLQSGVRDAERRAQLAEWLTSNQWFSIALVNRLWSEMVGEGFYEPIDDIGPDRHATAPVAVQLLAQEFRAHGYDLKWLLTTICQTEAYQRQSRPRRGPSDTPFTANVPQRLRSDQLFNALLTAVNVDEQGNGALERSRRRNQRRMLRPRSEFAALFGYDPSEAREGIATTIPQSLALMNSQEVNRHLLDKKKGLLGRLLKEVKDDEALIVELYLRCLSREPHDQEIAQALAYCRQSLHRSEAFEDLLWILINSAEFQYRS